MELMDDKKINETILINLLTDLIDICKKLNKYEIVNKMQLYLDIFKYACNEKKKLLLKLNIERDQFCKIYDK